jgi:hypothetical protein
MGKVKSDTEDDVLYLVNDLKDLLILSIEDRNQVIDWINAAKNKQASFIPSKDVGSLLGEIN